MEYTFFDFLTLIGSLGLFLYGMKVMSEGLQKVAGDRLRGILTAMTTNRVTGVLTGVLITALIQSSCRNDGDGCQFCKCRLTFFDTVGVGYYGCQCGYYRNGMDNFYFWL